MPLYKIINQAQELFSAMNSLSSSNIQQLHNKLRLLLI